MKYTEDIKIDESIKITKKDNERYIGKTFKANCGLEAKCIGIYDVYDYNSTKRYVVEFEDGRRGVAEGGKLRSGSFVPLPFTNKKCDKKVSIPEKLDLDKYTMSLEKKIQNLTDANRILRKQKRLFNRSESIDENFYNEVVKLLKQRHPIDNMNIHCSTSSATMIVQISDTHFGKFINTNGNKFNFKIAQARMSRYASCILDLALRHNIEKLVLVFTGDLFVLDSHLDCLLSNEDNRAVNFINGIDILSQFINKLLSQCEVEMFGVLGNESRVKADAYQSNIDGIASNSFDMMAYQVLQRMFGGVVKSLNNGDKLNDVLTLNGHNIAITHGDKYKSHDLKSVVQYKMLMMEEHNKPIHYVIFGHIHSSMITSNFSRSGSLCGSDEYAKNGLHISGGVASQNVYFVGKNVIGMEIRLD
ncbi:MAG: hypothetical protein ACRC7S_07280 [Cetobacterium sp.]